MLPRRNNLSEICLLMCESGSRPCIIRNSIQQNAGILTSEHSIAQNANEPLCMTLDDIVNRFENGNQDDIRITVDVTPDGHGDCIRTVSSSTGSCRGNNKQTHSSSLQMFVKPLEKQMTLTEFREKLRQGSSRVEKMERNQSNAPLLDENGRTILSRTEKRAFSLESQSSVDLSLANLPSDLPEESVLYYSRQVSLKISDNYEQSSSLNFCLLFVVPIHGYACLVLSA